MAFRTAKSKAATCPFCRMMRGAARNAIVGMTLSATVLATIILTYQHFAKI
ncbi:MAG TPA: hypothetical protein VIN57_00120 [Magnetovibrio sp.]